MDEEETASTFCEAQRDCAARYYCYSSDCRCNSAMLYGGRNCEQTSLFTQVGFALLAVWSGMVFWSSARVLWTKFWKYWHHSRNSRRYGSSFTAGPPASITATALNSLAILCCLCFCVSNLTRALNLGTEQIARYYISPLAICLFGFFTMFGLLNVCMLWVELAANGHQRRSNIKSTRKFVFAISFVYLSSVLVAASFDFFILIQVNFVYIVFLSACMLFGSVKLYKRLETAEGLQGRKDEKKKAAKIIDFVPKDGTLLPSSPALYFGAAGSCRHDEDDVAPAVSSLLSSVAGGSLRKKSTSSRPRKCSAKVSSQRFMYRRSASTSVSGGHLIIPVTAAAAPVEEKTITSPNDNTSGLIILHPQHSSRQRQQHRMKDQHLMKVVCNGQKIQSNSSLQHPQLGPQHQRTTKSTEEATRVMRTALRASTLMLSSVIVGAVFAVTGQRPGVFWGAITVALAFMQIVIFLLLQSLVLGYLAAGKRKKGKGQPTRPRSSP
mmetsp:Transcript_1803/g.3022  ORF Transcript_1803/g.3022 Transcript_1803/m.3022 type:complete len:495 (-) Transcript_1803:250-1734(-)